MFWNLCRSRLGGAWIWRPRPFSRRFHAHVSSRFSSRDRHKPVQKPPQRSILAFSRRRSRHQWTCSGRRRWTSRLCSSPKRGEWLESIRRSDRYTVQNPNLSMSPASAHIRDQQALLSPPLHRHHRTASGGVLKKSGGYAHFVKTSAVPCGLPSQRCQLYNSRSEHLLLTESIRHNHQASALWCAVVVSTLPRTLSDWLVGS